MTEKIRTHWEHCYLYHEECAENKSLDFLQRVLLTSKYELGRYERYLSAQKAEVEFLEKVIKEKISNQEYYESVNNV